MSNPRILAKYEEMKKVYASESLSDLQKAEMVKALFSDIGVIENGDKAVAKIAVTSVMIVRLEGFSEECDKPETFKATAEASQALKNWSHTAPKDGGYDKCKFEMKFEDGSEYAGRYDLKHYSCGVISLEKHVKEFLEASADDTNDYNRGYCDDAKEWLNKYSF